MSPRSSRPPHGQTRYVCTYYIYATCTSPILHLICPPKILGNLCLSFLLGITAFPREIENNAYAKCGGEGGGKKGSLWEMCKWRIYVFFEYIYFFFQSRVATQEQRSISLPLCMDRVYGLHIHAIATCPLDSGDVGRAKAHVLAWVSTLTALKRQENST